MIALQLSDRMGNKQTSLPTLLDKIGEKLSKRQDAKELIDKLFDQFDVDKSGYLDYEEVVLFLSSLFAIDNPVEQPKKEELEAAKYFVIETFDQNQDRKITRFVSARY